MISITFPTLSFHLYVDHISVDRSIVIHSLNWLILIQYWPLFFTPGCCFYGFCHHFCCVWWNNYHLLQYCHCKLQLLVLWFLRLLIPIWDGNHSHYFDSWNNRICHWNLGGHLVLYVWYLQLLWCCIKWGKIWMKYQNTMKN